VTFSNQEVIGVFLSIGPKIIEFLIFKKKLVVREGEKIFHFCFRNSDSLGIEGGKIKIK